MLLQEDPRAEKRNEERRADRQTLPLRLEPVPHLVDEDQPHEPDREPDAAVPEVRAERDEQPEQELVLEDADAELGDERADGSDRSPDPPPDLSPVGAPRLHRLLVAEIA